MNCSVCQQETSPVSHSGQVCCSICGTEYVVAPTPRRRSMDLSPHATSASAPPTPRTSKTAAALHNRAKTAHIIDLRTVTPKTEPQTTAHIVHPAHHDPAPPPKATTRQQALTKAPERIEEAKKHHRSPHIHKFANHPAEAPPSIQPAPPVSPPTPAIQPSPAPTVSSPQASQLPPLTATHHEAMTRLVLPAPPEVSKTQITAKTPTRRRFSLSPHNSRILATTTAVAIMAGYIWLNNYPKLAIQSANNKAGVAAALPGYIPSSYNLVSTEAIPGVVSLSYGSPSATDALKIAQTRTTWDSSSLLDNFVTKNTDDYATVQGQGLTIYLFNHGQATWVNRGIWYSIEGATRLSREQILKIAYSL